jgi:hypothetical protein
LAWTNTGQTNGGFTGLVWRAGDIAFGPASSGTSTLIRTLPSGGTLLNFTNPNTSFENMFVQFGSGYAMLPICTSAQLTDTFYTSTNGSTWTARSILSNLRWSSGLGSGGFAAIFASVASQGNRIISSRTVTVS